MPVAKDQENNFLSGAKKKSIKQLDPLDEIFKSIESAVEEDLSTY